MVRESTALVATKWVGLVAGMWVQASAGNAYMFSFYSPTLKSVLNYNQLQLNNLGVAKDIGENVGLLAGLLCNKVPAWTLLFIGALSGFFGYGTMWLVVSEQIPPLPYWQVSKTQKVLVLLSFSCSSDVPTSRCLLILRLTVSRVSQFSVFICEPVY